MRRARKGSEGLASLGAIPLRRLARPRADEAVEARLRQAWPLVVGAPLAPKTRLLRFHQGTLSIGCWETQWIPSLRSVVQQSLPELQARLLRLFKLRLSRIEILPCDPPPPETPTPTHPDPLEAVLHQLRAMREARVKAGIEALDDEAESR